MCGTYKYLIKLLLLVALGGLSTTSATLRTVSQISAGSLHTCALLDDATVKCWGKGEFGRLGYGNEQDRGDQANEMGDLLAPVDLGSGRTAVQISTGRFHTCALLDNARIKCWGGGAQGRLGYGDEQRRGDDPNEMGDSLPFIDLGTGQTPVQISTGGYHTCALLDDSTIKCWGAGGRGQLGYGNDEDRGDRANQMGDMLPAINLGTGRTTVQIAAGDLHTCAVLDDGTAKCWGEGDNGRLGYGDTFDRGDRSSEMGNGLPVVDLGTGRTAAQISKGEAHTCALLDDGTVKCWGANDRGQLGYGDTLSRGNGPSEMGDNLPVVDLGTGRTALHVSTGAQHTCALLDDATVKCWGEAGGGRLGNGDGFRNRGNDADEMGDFLPIVDLGNGRTAIQISTGDFHTCALLDDATVKCWGNAASGQLGYGNHQNRGDSSNEMGDNLPIIDLGVIPTPSPSSSPTSVPTLSSVNLCGKAFSSFAQSLERSSLGCSTLPTQIGLLMGLTRLELANSELVGSIPSQIGNLHKLQELFVNGNGLDKTLPTEVGRLANLKAFHVFDNKLTGTVPTELGLLGELTALTLSSNDFEQDLPSQLGELSGLEQVHVAQTTPFAAIPASLARLSNLVALTLGEVCDCQVAAIIEALPLLGATERFVAATCNGQPTTLLSSNDKVPCSPVRIAEVVNVTQKAAVVAWTYSNLTEIDEFKYAFDIDEYPGTIFRSALDQFIQLNTSTITRSDARKAIASCEAVFLSGGGNSDAWAFQFVLTNSKTAEATERCVFVGDDAITRRTSSGFLGNFEMSLGVEPGETYELKMRAVVLSFESEKLVAYKFGPLSNEQSIVAQDAVPSGPVVDLSVESKEDDRISLRWSEPLQPNGRIVRYSVVIRAASGLSGDGTNETFEASATGGAAAVFTFADLNFSSSYEITVIPETSKGQGPPARLTFETCPLNMRTLATDKSSCVAKRGFFLVGDSSKAIECASLGSAINLVGCLSNNVRVADLDISAGYWRPALNSFDIRLCPFGSIACNGGQNLSLCNPSYEGPLCAVCSEGFFSNGVECDRCAAPSSRSVMSLLFFISAALAAAIFFRCNVCTRSNDEFLFGGKFNAIFKVLVSTYQIMSTFLWTLGTAFPRLFTDIMNTFLVLNFDITDLIPMLQCMYNSSYPIELYMVTLFPIAVLAGFVLLYWIVRTCQDENEESGQDENEESQELSMQSKLVNYTILLTFFVYTPVSSKIFRAIRPCDEFADVGQKFMYDDYSVLCGSSEHSIMLGVAWGMLVLYLLGIPVFYGYLLWNRRKELFHYWKSWFAPLEEGLKPETDQELKSVSFLFQSYRYWWWEFAELARKGILAGVIAVIAPGSYEQSILLMLLALFSTFVYQYFMPMRESNMLGLIGHYAIFFAAFASVLVKLRADLLDSIFLDVLLALVVLAPLAIASIFVVKAICSKVDEAESGFKEFATRPFTSLGCARCSGSTAIRAVQDNDSLVNNTDSSQNGDGIRQVQTIKTRKPTL